MNHFVYFMREPCFAGKEVLKPWGEKNIIDREYCPGGNCQYK